MKIVCIKRIVLLMMLLFTCILASGCWNYREVEELAIVAGVALDVHEDGMIHVTVEVVDISAGGQTTYKPVYLEADGKTVFDAIRKIISIDGKKLYWSHVKLIILSEKIASQDVAKYLDFLYRDPETRVDIWMVVSTEKTAEEVLRAKGQLKPIISFQIEDTMRSQQFISSFPHIELFEFFDRLFYKNISPILPTVRLVKQNGTETPMVEGTAIFKNNKLVGTIDAEDTMCMLWLRNEVKGGVVVVENAADTGDNVALEIFKSRTKIMPILDDGIFVMKADVNMTVNIGEIKGVTNFMTEEGAAKLKAAAEKQIHDQIQSSFEKVRDQYDSDVFGFGRKLDMYMPSVWNQIKNQWEQLFSEVQLEVKVDVNIRGSASTQTPLKVGN
jgi:spore germination protein KC